MEDTTKKIENKKNIFCRAFLCAVKPIAFLFKTVWTCVVGIWKFIWRTIGLIACGLIAAVVLFFAAILCADYIVKFAVNNSVEYLDLNAHVDDVDIHLLTQTISAKGVTLKNPAGFIDKDALTAAKIEVKFDFFDKKSPVKRIYLQNPKFALEGKFGKRILASSLRRSNFFVILRELLQLRGIDLEKVMASGNSKNIFEKIDDIEKKSSLIDTVGEIRIDNLYLKNGMKDTVEIGSIVLHNDMFEISDVASNICGVESSMKGGVFDIQSEVIALTKFALKNPEGYPNANAMFVGKLQIKMGDKKNPKTGELEPCFAKITIDSPVVRLEDKEGSMLGALGIDNNFVEITRALSVFHGVDVSNMFNDDFEIAIRDKEIKVPKLAFGTTEILNAKITCNYNDGFLISKIKLDDGVIDVDDVRVNLAKIKMGFECVNIDAKNQMFTIENLALRNPEGFPEENAFLMKKFKLSTNIREENIKGNRVLVIDTLELSDFFVRLDSRTGELTDLIGEQNNLFALIEDFNAAAKFVPAYKDSVQQAINSDKSKRPHRYIIKKITFNGGEIRLGPRGEAIKIPMHDFAIENLGVEEGGVTSDKIVTILIKEIALRSIDSAEEVFSNQWGLLMPIIKAFHAIANMVI